MEVAQDRLLLLGLDAFSQCGETQDRAKAQDGPRELCFDRVPFERG